MVSPSSGYPAHSSPSYPNFGERASASSRRLRLRVPNKVRSRNRRFRCPGGGSPPAESGDKAVPVSVFPVTDTGKPVSHHTPLTPAQKKALPLASRPIRNRGPASTHKKRYSVEDVQDKDEDSDTYRKCEHIGRVDVERPTVLAVIIVHETCRRYKPPATLFCHGLWFLTQYI